MIYIRVSANWEINVSAAGVTASQAPEIKQFPFAIYFNEIKLYPLFIIPLHLKL